MLLVCSWCWEVGVAVSWPVVVVSLSYRVCLAGVSYVCLPGFVMGVPPASVLLRLWQLDGWPPRVLLFSFWLACCLAWDDSLRLCSLRKIFRGFFWPAPRVGGGGAPLAIVGSFS